MCYNLDTGSKNPSGHVSLVYLPLMCFSQNSAKCLFYIFVRKHAVVCTHTCPWTETARDHAKHLASNHSFQPVNLTDSLNPKLKLMVG